jgi:hypothetical protein
MVVAQDDDGAGAAGARSLVGMTKLRQKPILITGGAKNLGGAVARPAESTTGTRLRCRLPTWLWPLVVAEQR